MIRKYEQTEPSLMAKYDKGNHQNYSFHGISNIYLKLIMCEDNKVIYKMTQSYILHWYRTYLLYKVMDRTEAMIHQHL